MGMLWSLQHKISNCLVAFSTIGLVASGDQPAKLTLRCNGTLVTSANFTQKDFEIVVDPNQYINVGGSVVK